MNVKFSHQNKKNNCGVVSLEFTFDYQGLHTCDTHTFSLSLIYGQFGISTLPIYAMVHVICGWKPEPYYSYIFT